MIRKSDYTEYIDKYLCGELTGDDLREFNVEMATSTDLAEEVKLYQEIGEAIQEQDIAALRNNLQKVMKQKQGLNGDQEFEYVEDQYFNFDLSEEFSSFKEFSSPVNINDLINISESLPKIHLAQHKIAGKENIHQFYKEQNGKAHTEEELELTPLDEELVGEVQKALEEKDIADLRANLQQVAASTPAHQRSTQEIEEFIHGELEGMEQAGFEQEMEINTGLAKDIEFYRELDKATAENDIMDLRSSLQRVSKTESSTTRKTEEIDQYLNGELKSEELDSFETELTNNLDLVAELDLHQEIDQAIREEDIMELRAKLGNIGKDVGKQKRKEQSFSFVKMPSSRAAIATVAASLMLIFSIAGVISRNNKADGDELYSQYHETYQATGIFRSGDAILDSKLTKALHKFNSQEYESALHLFREVLEQDQNNPVSNFYAGMAHQETGKFDQAIRAYQTVIRDKDNLFVEQAQWYIGLCYLQTENRKKAFRQFKQIANSDSFYQQKANAVLRRIKHFE